MRRKIALIGAGNIGGNLAQLIAIRKLGDVVLYDLYEGLAKGKALDISESSSLLNFSVNVTGTSNIEEIKDADAVVVTAGIARKPGMQRDDLLKTNYNVIKEVATQIKSLAPNAFVIVVTNPLDVMAWTMYKFTGFLPNKVVGMAGVLDTARFRFFLAQELGVAPEDVVSMVLGGHGDTMVPLVRFTAVAGIPMQELLKSGVITRSRLESIIQRTRDGGAEIVKLLEKGSAFYSPAASVLLMLQSYLKDEGKVISCAVFAKGHYNVKDEIYVGLPSVISSRGAEILDVTLEPDEEKMFTESLEKVKELMKVTESIT